MDATVCASCCASCCTGELAGSLVKPYYQISKCNFSGACLSGAKFDNTILCGADLSHFDLTGTDFTQANLTEAILQNVRWSAAPAQSARVRPKIPCKCDGASSRPARLNHIVAIL